ncbi:EamA family transporter [Marinomonas epiphytica]
MAAAIRCLPAGLVLLALFGERLGKNQFIKMLVLSVLNISLFQGMLFIAAYNLPGGLAALVGAIQPALVVLLAFIVKGEVIAPRKLFMLASAFMGMCLIFLQNGSAWNLIGIGAAMVGTVSMSLGTFLSREWSNKLNIYAFTGYQLVFGGIVLLIVSPFYDHYPSEIHTRNLLGYAYLSVFGAIIAYSLWFNGVKRLPLNVSSSLGFLSPLSAICIGWLALGQSLNLIQISGVILVLVSLYLIILPNKKQGEPRLRSKLIK